MGPHWIYKIASFVTSLLTFEFIRFDQQPRPVLPDFGSVAKERRGRGGSVAGADSVNKSATVAQGFISSAHWGLDRLVECLPTEGRRYGVCHRAFGNLDTYTLFRVKK